MSSSPGALLPNSHNKVIFGILVDLYEVFAVCAELSERLRASALARGLVELIRQCLRCHVDHTQTSQDFWIGSILEKSVAHPHDDT